MAGKTRKASRSQKHLPMHMATMQHVNCWHKAMFEKLGYMILAKAKGYDYKISTYKKNVEHLHKTICHLMGEYQDPDRIRDLNVLKLNVECLLGSINRCL